MSSSSLLVSVAAVSLSWTVAAIGVVVIAVVVDVVPDEDVVVTIGEVIMLIIGTCFETNEERREPVIVFAD